MATDETKLYNKILDIFTIVRMEPDPDNPGFLRKVSPTMTIFAKELSDAYDDYAQDSETYAGNKLVSNGKTQMKTILLTLDAPGNTASFVALKISLSVDAYWASSAFAPMPPLPPGFSLVNTVTIAQPTFKSNGLLETAMATTKPKELEANLWAAALHQQTMSVKTTHVGLDTTVPTPLPKTEADKPIK